MNYAIEKAQRELNAEIDIETERLIRERGIPLYDAVEIAKRNIRQRRECSSGNKSLFGTLDSFFSPEKSQ